MGAFYERQGKVPTLVSVFHDGENVTDMDDPKSIEVLIRAIHSLESDILVSFTLLLLLFFEY